MKIPSCVQTPEVQKDLPLALLPGSFEDKCGRAAEYRADGFELIMANPTALDLASIRKGLDKNNLRPAAGEGARARLGSILSRAGDVAAERRGVIAIDPLNRYETDLIFNAGKGLVLLQEVDHPAVGLLIDTYHADIEEASRTEPFIRALESRKLLHVHIGDNNRLYPGGGLIDFTAVLGALKAHGYTGFVSAELLPRPDPDSAARLTATALRSILDRL